MIYKAFLFCIIATLLSVAPNVVMAQHANGGYAALSGEILKNINEHRAGIGLKPLTMNSIISAAAEKHSHNMATGKVPVGHDGVDQRVKAISWELKQVYGWAENVAMGPQTAKEVVDSWLNSKVHRENMEGDYNLTGIGIARGGDGNLYFTEIFINRPK